MPIPTDAALLSALFSAHSTPGDEGEVFSLLGESWRAAGWSVAAHGPYAISARLVPSGQKNGAPRNRPRPVLLVAAHADSPGFIVDGLPARGARSCGIATLGGPGLGDLKRARAVVKTRAGKFPATVSRASGGDGEWRCSWKAGEEPAGLALGDRVCFAPSLSRDGDQIKSPFLDNRLGCWLLALVAKEAASWRSRFDIVLGATSNEEFTGFGAAVLARQVAPDAVIALDATYENQRQRVRLGGGPVLTLSDASVVLSPSRRDSVAAIVEEAGAPLQFEAYNFSGTDARAFPRAGLPCDVLPILLPTRGNHCPEETADLRDAAALLSAIRALAEAKSWD